jgi:hypothetical protein
VQLEEAEGEVRCAERYAQVRRVLIVVIIQFAGSQTFRTSDPTPSVAIVAKGVVIVLSVSTAGIAVDFPACDDVE